MGTGQGGSHRSGQSSRVARYRKQARRGFWIWATVYVVSALAVLALLGPLALDRAMGAMKSTGECRILRVIDADLYALDCEVIGRQRAHLLGADTPSTRGVACRAEFAAGQRAKWAARRILWSAREVETRIDGFGWGDRTLVILRPDGEGLAGQLVAAGLARSDAGYSTAGWCSGQLDALATEADR